MSNQPRPPHVDGNPPPPEEGPPPNDDDNPPPPVAPVERVGQMISDMDVGEYVPSVDELAAVTNNLREEGREEIGAARLGVYRVRREWSASDDPPSEVVASVARPERPAPGNISDDGQTMSGRATARPPDARSAREFKSSSPPSSAMQPAASLPVATSAPMALDFTSGPTPSETQSAIETASYSEPRPAPSDSEYAPTDSKPAALPSSDEPATDEPVLDANDLLRLEEYLSTEREEEFEEGDTALKVPPTVEPGISGTATCPPTMHRYTGKAPIRYFRNEDATLNKLKAAFRTMLVVAKDRHKDKIINILVFVGLCANKFLDSCCGSEADATSYVKVLEFFLRALQSAATEGVILDFRINVRLNGCIRIWNGRNWQCLRIRTVEKRELTYLVRSLIEIRDEVMPGTKMVYVSLGGVSVTKTFEFVEGEIPIAERENVVLIPGCNHVSLFTYYKGLVYRSVLDQIAKLSYRFKIICRLVAQALDVIPQHSHDSIFVSIVNDPERENVVPMIRVLSDDERKQLLKNEFSSEYVLSNAAIDLNALYPVDVEQSASVFDPDVCYVGGGERAYRDEQGKAYKFLWQDALPRFLAEYRRLSNKNKDKRLSDDEAIREYKELNRDFLLYFHENGYWFAYKNPVGTYSIASAKTILAGLKVRTPVKLMGRFEKRETQLQKIRENFPPIPSLPEQFSEKTTLGGLDDRENLMHYPIWCLYLACTEYFEATDNDIEQAQESKRARLPKPIVGQVGLRCIFCSDYPTFRDRASGSCSYPASTEKLRRSVEWICTTHLPKCKGTTPEVKAYIAKHKGPPKTTSKQQYTLAEHFEYLSGRLGLVNYEGEQKGMYINK